MGPGTGAGAAAGTGAGAGAGAGRGAERQLQMLKAALFAVLATAAGLALLQREFVRSLNKR